MVEPRTPTTADEAWEAWEALRGDVYGALTVSESRRAIAHHRPLIEAAILTEPRAEGLLDALRPLFAEYDEADMARRVGKGNKHDLLVRVIDAKQALLAALALRAEPEAEGLREALLDFVALLPPDRWKLLRPGTITTLEAIHQNWNPGK